MIDWLPPLDPVQRWFIVVTGWGLLYAVILVRPVRAVRDDG